MLPGFQILARHSLFSAATSFFVKPRCLTLSPKNMNTLLIQVQKSSKHIAGRYKKLLCVFKREAVEFLVAKNFAVSHFALTAGSPSCHSNLTRDRKTVVTWLSEFCSLHFPMKNLMLKVSNVPALYLTGKNRQAMGGGGWGEQITSGRVRRRPGSIWQILVLNLWE